jgi:hypothetical protein
MKNSGKVLCAIVFILISLPAFSQSDYWQRQRQESDRRQREQQQRYHEQQMRERQRNWENQQRQAESRRQNEALNRNNNNNNNYNNNRNNNNSNSNSGNYSNRYESETQNERKLIEAEKSRNKAIITKQGNIETISFHDTSIKGVSIERIDYSPAGRQFATMLSYFNGRDHRGRAQSVKKIVLWDAETYNKITSIDLNGEFLGSTGIQ